MFSNLNLFHTKLRQFYNSLTDIKTVFIVTAIALSIIGRTSIISVFDHLLTKPFLSHITSSAFSDVTLILLTLIYIILIVKLLGENTRIHIFLFLAALTLLTAYLYFRVQGVHYDYTPFVLFRQIKYADIVILFCSGMIALKGLEWLSPKYPVNYYEDPFIADLPIRRSSDDLLNRKQFAKRIAEKIQSKIVKENAGALAIGITGPWGSGKTSFAYMVLENLDKERIIVHFNPWRSSSSSKIIEDFFELLIGILSKYDPNLSRNVYRYAKTLTQIDENKFTKGLKGVSDYFEERNKNELYDAVNRSIATIYKQIVIFIDDLDRLDKSEILEVLRIIRNTANFNNVIYLVAYDKGYALEAVKSFNPHNHASFLEKIFQFEFSLPLYESVLIRKFIRELLEPKLSEGFKQQLLIVLDSRGYKAQKINDELIQTHREAIRLSNSLLFEIKDIEDDILFYDFYLLQLLKIKYPIVYNDIIQSWDTFFIIYHEKNENYFRFRNESERNKETGGISGYFDPVKKNAEYNNDKNQNTEIFANYLNELKQKIGYNDKDISNINLLIKELINADRVLQNLENESYKAFVHPNNFFKYFAFQLLEGEISAKDFEKARKLSFQDYEKIINEWVSDNKYGAFLDKLYKIRVFVNQQEFENHVLALFKVGKDYVSNDRQLGFDYKHLMEILKYPATSLKTTDIRLYPDLVSYQDFLLDLFEQAKFPAEFESNLINQIISYQYEFPLDFSKLATINMQYFQSYLNKQGDISNTFWNLFHNCKMKASDGLSKEKNAEAKTLCIDYYLAHLSTEKLGQLINQTNPDSDYYYFSPDNLNFFFNDFQELENWLTKAEQLDRQHPAYLEFVDFVNKIKVNNFNSIKFDFKQLIPVRWRSM
ncbi:KAP family P-loop NTPase fold protein [Mucilaginibacter gossypii]|uniref:KAP family P-loop domain-containing protein n=1 Tax=Mucilaginibacter gossypii TaxID=551996 RepID=A0A1G8D3G0_9SPHI|nr:P-loop NTPase fold protein [Mucilaginibacter gossypii]SDH52266.1 KAP family P-loop domain-containing protein [Mucilaginibacter gossypii]